MAKAKVAELVASKNPRILTREEMFYALWVWKADIEGWDHENEYLEEEEAIEAGDHGGEPYHILKITLPAI